MKIRNIIVCLLAVLFGGTFAFAQTTQDEDTPPTMNHGPRMNPKAKSKSKAKSKRNTKNRRSSKSSSTTSESNTGLGTTSATESGEPDNMD